MTKINTITSFQLKMYNTIRLMSYVIYFLALFGITLINPALLNNLESFIQIYISLFLIYRFNPFTSITFNELDRKIAFSAGVFLLMTTSINQIVKLYLMKIKTLFKP